jgi:hypothetical protein
VALLCRLARVHVAVTSERSEGALSEEVQKTSTPMGSSEITDAMRLGWAVVKLQCLSRRTWRLVTQSSEPGHMLALGDERTPKEQAQEAENAILHLTESLKIAEPFPRSTGPKSGNEVPLWGQNIQQQFAVRSPRLGAAYELGVAFAQIRSGLVEQFLSKPPSRVYLGKERVLELRRLIRIVAVWDPLTMRALDSSLRTWGRIASDRKLWQDQQLVQDALVQQCAVWHDLLMGGVEAGSLLTPDDEARSSAWAGVRVIRQLWPLYLVSVLALAIVALLLGWANPTVGSLSPTETRAAGLVAAVLAAFGATTIGVQTRARSLIESFWRTRRDDLVIAAATELPDYLRGRPDVWNKGRNLLPDPVIERWLRDALLVARGGLVTGPILWLLLGLFFWGLVFGVVQRWGSISAQSLWLGGFIVYAYAVAAASEPRAIFVSKLSRAAFVLVGLYGAALIVYWILKDSGRIDQAGPFYLIPIIVFGLVGLIAQVIASNRLGQP